MRTRLRLNMAWRQTSSSLRVAAGRPRIWLAIVGKLSDNCEPSDTAPPTRKCFRNSSIPYSPSSRGSTSLHRSPSLSLHGVGEVGLVNLASMAFCIWSTKSLWRAGWTRRSGRTALARGQPTETGNWCRFISTPRKLSREHPAFSVPLVSTRLTFSSSEPDQSRSWPRPSERNSAIRQSTEPVVHPHPHPLTDEVVGGDEAALRVAVPQGFQHRLQDARPLPPAALASGTAWELEWGRGWEGEPP